MRLLSFPLLSVRVRYILLAADSFLVFLQDTANYTAMFGKVLDIGIRTITSLSTGLFSGSRPEDVQEITADQLTKSFLLLEQSSGSNCRLYQQMDSQQTLHIVYSNSGTGSLKHFR